MSNTYFGKDPWTLWWQGMLAAIAIVVVAAVVFPQMVYEGFIWKYFWGPVVADGQGFNCVAYAGGAELPCIEAGVDAGATAEPGYTTVSTISYAVVLLAFLIGVYLGIDRFEIDATPALFFALVPFLFLGGAMRALEDATVLLSADAGNYVLSFPLTAILISPIIYFFVFFIAAITIAVSVYLSRRQVANSYELPVAATGAVLLVIAIGYLLYLVSLIPDNTISLPMFAITIGGATITAAAVWVGASTYIPTLNDGTGRIGPLLIWGHAVDGFANVLSLDWGPELGLGRSYGSKHVINEAITTTTEVIQPAAISDAIGTAWPFLIVKVAVATLVVYLFNDELLDDSPRFFMLLLLAVLAVGLGPGTRDLLRATFGI